MFWNSKFRSLYRLWQGMQTWEGISSKSEKGKGEEEKGQACGRKFSFCFGKTHGGVVNIIYKDILSTHNFFPWLLTSHWRGHCWECSCRMPAAEAKGSAWTDFQWSAHGHKCQELWVLISECFQVEVCFHARWAKQTTGEQPEDDGGKLRMSWEITVNSIVFSPGTVLSVLCVC